MSTHCYLGTYEKKSDKIEDFKSLIYQHHDGYPGSMNLILKEFFKKNRNYESEVMGVKLLQFLINRFEDYFQNDITFKEEDNDEFAIHRDIRISVGYFYKIYRNDFEIYENINNEWKIIKNLYGAKLHRK